MKFGLMIFPTLDTPSPAELGRIAEGRGFESLFFPEHTHIPASRETPYPAGGELPPEYSRTYDPFIALTAAACATQTLIVGTGICLVVERDPITTAKEVASLDHISGGRFIFGVGLGWNREEMRNHGTDPRTRRELMGERVEAMKAIWTEEEASYHGEHVDFDRIWSWPKPLQQPHPPIYVGGNGPTVLDRVLRFGDAWMPNVIDDDTLLAQIAELRERAGRDVPVSLFAAPRDPERLARYAEAGVERALFWLPPRDREALEKRLATDRALIDSLG
ncbi:MAG: class F420-dependent oxidoreductase [Solirubrobacterales bacterium]|nr:class F420-dependent oxidoreductase [Solirubrobacterales bacterium]